MHNWKLLFPRSPSFGGHYQKITLNYQKASVSAQYGVVLGMSANSVTFQCLLSRITPRKLIHRENVWCPSNILLVYFLEYQALWGFQCCPRRVSLDTKHLGIVSEVSLIAQKPLGRQLVLFEGFESPQRCKVSNKGRRGKRKYIPSWGTATV